MSSCCCQGRAATSVARQSLKHLRRGYGSEPAIRAFRLTGTLRFASTQAGSYSIASTSSIPPAFFQPNIENAFPSSKDKGKGKETSPLRSKEDVLCEIVWEAQSAIEDKEVWEATSTRYPGMRHQQVTLVAVLQVLLERCKQRGISLLPHEILRLHRMMIELDKDGQRQHLWTSRFQRSTVAYSILLKYAHTCKDARALKHIAREAMTWRNTQGRSIRGDTGGVRNRSIHPRVAAADNLTRLVRNLFVSLAVSQRAKLYFESQQAASGLELPNSALRMSRGDDAITISALMRQRVGAYDLGTNEDGTPQLLPSRLIKDASYPITHLSRRRRRINRLIERGKLQQVSKVLSRTGSMELGPKLLAEGMERPTIPQSHTAELDTKTIATELRPNLDIKTSSSVNTSGNKEIEQMLTQYKPNTIKGGKMQALLYTYERWHAHLCKRFEAKKTLTSTLWQFNLSPRTATQEDLDAIKQVIPAWLLLSILRLHIETGERDRAEKVVAAYLQSHQRIYRDKRLVDVIPINAKRVHAISSPITPPNSASLLNGILRAALVSGAADAFDWMAIMMQKWCYLGNHFSRYVLSSRVQVESHPVGKSLLPDDKTVLLLLEGLRYRKKNFSMGVRLVETMWSRWGIVGRGNERLDFIEPKLHEILVIPTQAFVTLMNWALQDKLLSARQKKVARIQSMQAEWTDKIAKMESEAPKLNRDEIAAWLNVNKKAQASLSQTQ